MKKSKENGQKESTCLEALVGEEEVQEGEEERRGRNRRRRRSGTCLAALVGEEDPTLEVEAGVAGTWGVGGDG